MLYPSIDEMLSMVDSKYTLVVAASRRARKLREGAKSDLRKAKSYKYVGIALEELYSGLIHLERIVEDGEDAMDAIELQ
jgi:DNA-directed RNA polymerase subunit omega